MASVSWATRVGVNLARAGYLGVVYNKTVEKAMRFRVDHGVEYVAEPEGVPGMVDVVPTVLSDDQAVSSVVEHLLPHLNGKVLVDMSTVSPTLSVGLAGRVRSAGAVMLDAPIVGSSTMV